ncbi:MAG: DUF1887 family CARF protein [Bacillota bacterium]
MIALVSEQRMQNVIPCYQAGAAFAEVHLVRSLQADDPGLPHARARADTIGVLERVARVVDVEPAVDAFDIEATRAAVGRAAADLVGRGLEPVVNFTGGTKCMAVGAYLAAVEAGCAGLYVDTENERLLWYHPDGRMVSEPFALQRVDVPLYLKAYGLTVSQHGHPERARRLAPLLDLILAFWPRCVPRLEEWTQEVKENKKNAVLRLVEGPGLFEERFLGSLAENGLLERTANGFRPTDGGVRFLTGEWLELLVYHLLRRRPGGRERGFDHVWWQVKLAGVENELDVAATGRGRLVVIECKSGDPGGQDTLNRLQALRHRLGLFARLCFVTSRPADGVPGAFRERAREYGIRDFIARENLLDITALLAGRP